MINELNNKLSSDNQFTRLPTPFTQRKDTSTSFPPEDEDRITCDGEIRITCDDEVRVVAIDH